MRKRLRKKKYLGEFADLGFQIYAEVSSGSFLDEFIEFLESRGLVTFCVMSKGRVAAIVSQERVNPDICVCDTRDGVMRWVAYRVDDCEVGPVYDINHEDCEDFFQRLM